MSREASDLRNAGLYLFALVILGGGLVLGGMVIAERASANGLFAAMASFFEPEPERAPTRLSIAFENALEIQAALAKPMPPLAPLPPITAKLAYGHLKPGTRVAQRPLKLSKEAMDAMASAGARADTRSAHSALAPVELHRFY